MQSLFFDGFISAGALFKAHVRDVLPSALTDMIRIVKTGMRKEGDIVYAVNPIKR